MILRACRIPGRPAKNIFITFCKMTESIADEFCMPWHMPGVFWHTLWHTPKTICKLDYALLQNQYSFAPAGMWGSTIRRCSFSSSPSLWMADSSMPQDSMPIMGLGGKLVMAMQVFPTSSSGS